MLVFLVMTLVAIAFCLIHENQFERGTKSYCKLMINLIYYIKNMYNSSFVKKQVCRLVENINSVNL